MVGGGAGAAVVVGGGGGAVVVGATYGAGVGAGAGSTYGAGAATGGEDLPCRPRAGPPGKRPAALALATSAPLKTTTLEFGWSTRYRTGSFALSAKARPTIPMRMIAVCKYLYSHII